MLNENSPHIYEREIDEHIARWNYPKNKEDWKSEIERMVDFAIRRPAFMETFVMEEFGIALGIDDSSNIKGFSAKIYPNPCHNILHLKIISPYISNFRIKICDIMGKNIYINNFLVNYYCNRTIYLDRLSEGVYIINIISDKDSVFEKIYIKK